MVRRPGRSNACPLLSVRTTTDGPPGRSGYGPLLEVLPVGARMVDREERPTRLHPELRPRKRCRERMRRWRGDAEGMFIAVTRIKAPQAAQERMLEGFRRGGPELKRFPGFLGFEWWRTRTRSRRSRAGHRVRPWRPTVPARCSGRTTGPGPAAAGTRRRSPSTPRRSSSRVDQGARGQPRQPCLGLLSAERGYRALFPGPVRGSAAVPRRLEPVGPVARLGSRGPSSTANDGRPRPASGGTAPARAVPPPAGAQRGGWPGWPSPTRAASSAASTRLRTCSLVRMLVM
jgi:hypothetical protein